MEKKRLQIIKDLFEAALHLKPSERELFLNDKCADDTDLKNEVLSLLNILSNTDDFLEENLKNIDESKSAFKDPLIGKSIGPYLIEGIAGRGGMGVVYSGRRNDNEYKQKVAIKIIGFGLTSDYILRRFKIERQILASLRHPNISRLLDGGRTPEGLPYLVMEYIDGIPITQYADENNLNISGILKLFREICSAVQYAHQNLIIHRDIKPGNILVTKDGIPMLLDFGIVKLLDENLVDDADIVTRTELRHLTPEFASPEQINGDNITTASDIYSLGVLLYRLLTNSMPYQVKGISITSISKILKENIIPRPSQAIANKNDNKNQGEHGSEKPDISAKQLKGDLDNIIMKAMNIEPLRRYVSVEQFSEDIRRYQVGLPVIARRDTTGYVLSKFVKRHKVGFVSTLLFILFLIGSVVIVARQESKTKTEMKIAQTEAKKAERINEFLQNMLASADPYQSGKDVKVYDILKKASKNVRKEFKGQPEIEASIQSTIGNTFTYLGDYKMAEEHLYRAYNLNRRNYGQFSRETASSLHDLAVYYDWLGKIDSAADLYKEADNIFRNIEKKPDLDMEINLSDYASLQNENGNYELSEKMYSGMFEYC